MDLTSLAATSLLLVGVGYAFVRRGPRFRFVCWGILCLSLFALATRDLFRSREQGRPPPASDAGRPNRRDERLGADRSESVEPDRRTRPSPVSRLRRRIAGWLD